VSAIEALGLNDAAIVAHYTNARMIFLTSPPHFFTLYNAPGETFSECSGPLLFSAFVFERRRRPGGWDRPLLVDFGRKRRIFNSEARRILTASGARLADFF
jgi:hypothetical protein